MELNDAIALKAINDQNIDLSKYKSITESAAKLLFQSDVFHLIRLQSLGIVGLLNGPSQLWRPEEVRDLYKTRVLNFDGMPNIYPEAAKYIFKRRGRKWTCVYLNGIKSLNPELAACFSGHEGNLFLNGLKSISSESAKLLCLHSGHLSLDGINEIDINLSKILGSYNGFWLSLNGLKSLQDTCGENLMTYDRSHPDKKGVFAGNIRLNGLKTISDRLASCFSRNYAGIQLDGLQSITKKQALFLTNHKGGLLSLNGIREISNEVAESLVSYHKGALHLNGIAKLTEGLAEIFGRYKGTELFLDGLNEISESCAKKLINFKGWDLSLRGLVDPTIKVVDILNSASVYRIYFKGTTKPGKTKI
jgi:hypothetical protein